MPPVETWLRGWEIEARSALDPSRTVSVQTLDPESRRDSPVTPRTHDS